MAAPESNRNNHLIRVLASGAKKVFENAEQLFKEASLLRSHGALSRALFLHQISMEECAKVESLGASAVGMLTGQDIDIQKVWVKLMSHKVKNYINAYMLTPTEQEKDARQRGDLKGSIEAFEKLQVDFHQESNTSKNASLYVDFKDRTFAAPTEIITETMVSALAEKNFEYLANTYPKVKMIMSWEENIDEAQHSLTWCKTRLQKLRSDKPDKIEVALTTLLQELFEAKIEGGARDGRDESNSETNEV